MLKNNRWYKYKNGKSILFKEGFGYAFGYTYTRKIDNWCKSKRVYFGENIWEEVTSPKVVLEAINKGMKLKGYHNNITLQPFSHISKVKVRGSIITLVKLKNFYFDFNDKKSVDLLMNKGELWLTDNKGYICILKDGKLAK